MRVTPDAAPKARRPNRHRAIPLNLSDAPDILTIEEIARVIRLSKATIRRRLAHGSFRPLPFDQHPYRWRREDVSTDIQRRAIAAEDLNIRRAAESSKRRRARRRAESTSAQEQPAVAR